MTSKTKQDLSKLREQDMWSLVLFSLYKLQNVPSLSTLSRLSYTLDRSALLSLCEVFGGKTIKIPTLCELETVIYSLILYQMVNIDGCDFTKSFDYVSTLTNNITQVRKSYMNLCEILNKYSFENE